MPTPSADAAERTEKPSGPGALHAVIERLKRVKHIEWILLLIVGAIAVTALTSNFAPQKPLNDVLIGSADDAANTDQEVKLARVLENMRGVGKVRVMIAYEEDEATAFGTSKARRAVSAIVVAEGADDLAVRMELVRAVRTALNLPAQGIAVFSMGE